MISEGFRKEELDPAVVFLENFIYDKEIDQWVRVERKDARQKELDSVC